MALDFPTQEQIAAKKAQYDLQLQAVKLQQPTIADQFHNKLKQHAADITKLNRLLALYDRSDDVREFAELLDIRLN